MKPLRILFAGGGTGGHVYPALAVADEIRRLRPEAAVIFVGARQKIESRAVPQHGYDFHAISISGLRRSVSLQALLFPLQVLIALVQSLMLLVRLRPAVVVGTGGYVSGPPVAAAWMLGIPSLLQEQNSYPGVTTRLLSRVAREVHVAFAATARHLPRTDTMRLTGTPTRTEIGTIRREDAAPRLQLDPARRTLLVLGGSQGAASINNAVLAALPWLREQGVQILWATGRGEFPRVERALQERLPGGDPRVRLLAYIDQMADAYAVADLVVSRAGATTLAEIMQAGLPALLVPYPHAADDHQTENARTLVEAHAAVLVADAELPVRFGTELRALLDDAPRRHSMGERAHELSHPDAARHLAEAVLDLAEQER